MFERNERQLIIINDKTTYADLAAMRTTLETFDLKIESTASLPLIQAIALGSFHLLDTVYSLDIRPIVDTVYIDEDVSPTKKSILLKSRLNIHSEFLSLPLEVIYNIISFMSTTYDIVSLLATNKQLHNYMNSPLTWNNIALREYSKFNDKIIYDVAKSLEHEKVRKMSQAPRHYFFSALELLKLKSAEKLTDKIIQKSARLVNNNDNNYNYFGISYANVKKILHLFTNGGLEKILQPYLKVVTQTLNPAFSNFPEEGMSVFFQSVFDQQTQQMNVDITIGDKDAYTLMLSGSFKLRQVFDLGAIYIEMELPFELHRTSLITGFATPNAPITDLYALMVGYADRHVLNDLKKWGIELHLPHPLIKPILLDDSQAFFAFCEDKNIKDILDKQVQIDNERFSVLELLHMRKCYNILHELLIRKELRLNPNDGLFWQAIEDGEFAIVKQFIDQFRQVVPEGDVMAERLKARKWLIHYNTKSKMNLIEFVIHHRQPAILQYILTQFNLTDEERNKMINCIRNGKREGESALHMVIKATFKETNQSDLKALFDMAVLLIEHGINVDIVDENEMKALRYLRFKSCKLSGEQKQHLRKLTAKTEHVNQKTFSSDSRKKERIKEKFNFSIFAESNDEGRKRVTLSAPKRPKRRRKCNRNDE